MALDSINVVVREGDSFDELFINIEKPWGTPHDYSNSVLVADIRRFFNDNTEPTSVVGSWGIVELDPTQGKLQLKLTSRQTESLGRITPLGYEDRDMVPSGASSAVDVTDEPQGPFLWDLREYFTVPTGKSILSIAGGSTFTDSGGNNAQRLLVTTEDPHGLTSEDQILITGTGVSAYDGVNLYTNKLSILSSTKFEIEPANGAPAFVDAANKGRINVYKEDTLAIGTLQVVPRITRDSIS